MPTYFVNKNAQANGDHEVHAAYCEWLPEQAHRLYLGAFTDGRLAIEAAGMFYAQVNGCAHCSPECRAGDDAGSRSR